MMDQDKLRVVFYQPEPVARMTIRDALLDEGVEPVECATVAEIQEAMQRDIGDVYVLPYCFNTHRDQYDRRGAQLALDANLAPGKKRIVLVRDTMLAYDEICILTNNWIILHTYYEPPDSWIDYC